MANAFEKELGIPLPQCCSQGDCCRGASPSTPIRDLWQKAADGNEFARGFLSIMQPYASHAEAEAVVPGLVARTKAAALKNEAFQTEDDLVFYHCRYVTADNRCAIHEDRPQFCRDYPDTPYVVMAPGCAFEPWAAACKTKVDAMKAEIAQLKDLKAQLHDLRTLQGELKQTD
ncbi:MAG: YkgJ family cysteine cluster protein [Candidatus Melainabacteria bacterium]